MQLPNLNHSWMIIHVLSRPWITILHHPLLFLFFLAFAANSLIFTLNSSCSLCKSAKENVSSLTRIIEQHKKKIKHGLYICSPHLHGPAILNKCWVHLIFQVIKFPREIKLRCPWLNVILVTKRNPYSSKLSSF